MPASLLWLVSALAFAEPTGEFDLTRLDDPGVWHKAGRQLLDGPEGCIEVQGRVRIQISLYSAGGLLSAGGRRDVVGEGRFEGRLDNGVWTRLDTTWTEQPASESISLEIDRFHPIVGRLPANKKGADDLPAPLDVEDRYTEDEIVMVSDPDPEGQLAITKDEHGIRVHMSDDGQAALGVLDEIIDDIDPDGTAVYVTYNDDIRAVEMTESVPLDEGGVMAIHTRFPGGGAPTWLDASFPKRLKVREDGMSFTIRDAQMHLRSKETDLGVVPGVEGMSAVVGAMGFTVGLDQRVAYDRVRACR